MEEREAEIQKARLEILENLFEHPGWRLIVDDAKREIDEIKEDLIVHDISPTWESVLVRRARVGALAELINLPIVVSAQRAHLEELNAPL